LPCFKIHRPESGTYSCTKSRKDTYPNKIIVKLEEKEEGLTKDVLQKLAESESLKKRLDDEHLQKYLIALDTSDNPDDLFDQLKENQRFQEFYNETLDIITKKV
jgi:hypothetical protein